MRSQRRLVRPQSKQIGQPFIIDIDTRNVNGGSDANSFDLPLRSLGLDYDFIVDWGDGATDHITDVNQSENLHTYAVQGVKRITITGKCPLIDFGDHTAERNKLISIVSFGNCEFINDWTGSFSSCVNLKSILQASPIDWLINGDRMFTYCVSLDTIAEGTYFPSLTIAVSMFQLCSSLSSIPNSMVFDNVVNADNIFFSCPLTSLPPNMVMGNATSISSIFRGTQITSLPSGITFAKVQNAIRAFLDSGITNVPVGISFPDLTDGTNIFYSAALLTEDYSNLLIRMAAQNFNTNVPFSARLSKYNSTAVNARQTLIDRGWTISDSGLI